VFPQKRLIAFFNAFYAFSPANPRSICFSLTVPYLFSSKPYSAPCTSRKRSHLRSSTLACADCLAESPNSRARSSISSILARSFAGVCLCLAAYASAFFAIDIFFALVIFFILVFFAAISHTRCGPCASDHKKSSQLFSRRIAIPFHQQFSVLTRSQLKGLDLVVPP
jgi:hypothetical protein